MWWWGAEPDFLGARPAGSGAAVAERSRMRPRRASSGLTGGPEQQASVTTATGDDETPARPNETALKRFRVERERGSHGASGPDSPVINSRA
ncbi:hypothetical protein EYF80_049006 [Liparis tanakae]|uniref:Uncharacterized protein n=1 Tax=Liparis tanakae TaxID=230148 RepID=A0A4Z2FJ82_9TELE|nr:hypothetical protein EYF80_049006 [Liparis tanakae]